MNQEYKIIHVNNGYLVCCPICGHNIFTELEYALNHIDEEENPISRKKN